MLATSYSDINVTEPEIIESESIPDIVCVSEEDGVFFNTSLAQDRRLRRVIYDKIIKAKNHLPGGLTFMIYEAYRPRARQIELWDLVREKIRAENAGASEADLDILCSQLIANPYHVGSGHQFGCAVDITLCTLSGEPLDMGTQMQEFCAKTETDSSLISKEQKENRAVLKTALEMQGLVNYPPEWWHYSYGDRLWAILTNHHRTHYGVLPF